MLACGERNGGGVGKCVWVWGPNTLPHISSLTFPYLPYTPTHFPTPLRIPFPTSPLPPPIPQHIFLLYPHLPSPSQSVAKLSCDEVSMAKLLPTVQTLTFSQSGFLKFLLNIIMLFSTQFNCIDKLNAEMMSSSLG